jgi:transposase-like protein
MAVVVATAVTVDGRPDILSLEGVRLVISEQHDGLVAALARVFRGVRLERINREIKRRPRS